MANQPGSTPAVDLESSTRLEAVEGREATYRATLSKSWEIWGPNGGYLATLAMRAAGLHARIARPATFYCQFLRVAAFEPVEVRVEVLHGGRRAEAIRVSMTQQGKAIAEAQLRTAAACEGLRHAYARAPEAPAPETLGSMEDHWKGGNWHAFWENLEARVIQPGRFEDPRPSLEPYWLEWYRFRPRATFSDPFVDAARSLILLDTLCWPATWLQHPKGGFIAPSIDVVAHFHAASHDSEWLLCEVNSPVAGEGLVAGQGRVFDRGGRLVASGSSQLLCAPSPW